MNTAHGSVSLSAPMVGNVSDKAVFPPRGKYRGELWTKKFKHMDESWTTCNKEYGDFVPRTTVVKMDGSQEVMDDGGPWMASSYQMGYNVRPEMRKKWLNSWRGFVKRKVDLSQEEMKDLISPNTYKKKAPPMERGEGWVDNGPWGSSTYQMGYNTAPDERDPKPIYRFTRESPTVPGSQSPEQVVKAVENNPYKTIRRQELGSPKKAHPGVKLPPINDVPDRARQDIQIHKGKIYMAKQKEKKVEGVNENFFNFKYRPYWKPLNVYKSARSK